MGTHRETNIKKAENKEILTEKVCIHKMPQINWVYQSQGLDKIEFDVKMSKKLYFILVKKAICQTHFSHPTAQL